MMMDSVVWAQYINVTHRQPHSHVAIAIAAITHCVGRQNLPEVLQNNVAKAAFYASNIPNSDITRAGGAI